MTDPEIGASLTGRKPHGVLKVNEHLYSAHGNAVSSRMTEEARWPNGRLAVCSDMARTIDEGFRLLRTNLEITNLQEKTVSSRQTAIRSVIEKDFAVLDSFLTGSYRRNTMISPLKEADVDILVVLDPKYYAAHGQIGLLTAIRGSLLKTYTKTPKIRPDGHAVTITFSDFKVDVVPGFFREGGGYLIPDTNGPRWIPTDPKRHVEIWSQANKAHNGDLIPLLKMLKGWNASRRLLRSFHLETLALDILTDVTISSFPSGVRFFFEKARAKIKTQLADPAGYSDDVAQHINTNEQVDAIVKRLDWALARAQEAEKLAAAGKTADAFARWRQLIPNHFPAYG
jgi:Second Messenger Oligonucleotide or Dinucleotide Synthetase domain